MKNGADPKSARPLPAIGDRIQLLYPGKNPNNWPRAGLVRAIIDDHIVVKRWLPRKRQHVLVIVDAATWESNAFTHKPRRKI